MAYLDEIMFRQRIKHLNPKMVELMPIASEIDRKQCEFCSARSAYWMQRVYSFGVNIDRVCDSCARKWKSRKKR